MVFVSTKKKCTLLQKLGGGVVAVAASAAVAAVRQRKVGGGRGFFFFMMKTPSTLRAQLVVQRVLTDCMFQVDGVSRNECVATIGLEVIVSELLQEILHAGVRESEFDERVLAGDFLFHVLY